MAILSREGKKPLNGVYCFPAVLFFVAILIYFFTVYAYMNSMREELVELIGTRRNDSIAVYVCRMISKEEIGVANGYCPTQDNVQQYQICTITQNDRF